MAEPVINVREPARFEDPDAEPSTASTAEDQGGLQAIRVGATMSPGPVRDMASNLDDSFGLEADAQFRAGKYIFDLGVEVRSRTTGDETGLDTRIKFYAVDMRTLWQKPGSEFGAVLVQRAGFDAVTTSGEKDGGGLRPGNSDEIAIAIRRGRSWYPNMISFRLDHGSPLLSTDETAAPWELTEGVYIGWAENFYGPRDDLTGIDNEILKLKGADGSGGEVALRRTSEDRLKTYRALLSDLEIVDLPTTEGARPKYRHDLDQVVYEYGQQLTDVSDLVLVDFVRPQLQKKIRDRNTPADERETLRAVQEKLDSETLTVFLSRRDDESRPLRRKLQELLAQIDREAVTSGIRKIYLKKKRSHDRNFGDLDQRIAALEAKKIEMEKGRQTALLPYHAANIVARSWTSIQMNNLAEQVYSIEGTRDKGRLFMGVNLLYDTPIVLSVEGFIQNLPNKWAQRLSAAALGAFGAYEIAQGNNDDNLGQMSHGMLLTTAVIQTLPGLFQGEDGEMTRLGLVAAAAIGFGIAGAISLTNDDAGDDAMGYRMLSIGGNQLLAGGIIFTWGP